jgi:hypothetical protein
LAWVAKAAPNLKLETKLEDIKMRRFGVTVGALALSALVSASAFGQIDLGGGGAANLNVNPGGAKVESKGNANSQGNANVQSKANAQSKGNVQTNANRNNDAARRATNNANRDGVNIGGRDGINVDAGRNGLQVDSQRNKDRDNDRRNNNDRRDDLTRRGRIGDSDWDRFGVGRLDNDRYRNYSGNQWRYKRYGSDWFYWMPAGYWMYYGNGRWNRYDADSYATYYYGDNYVQPQQAVQANFNGPFYEDSAGFYYMNGNQRVYDPSIQRVAATDGAVQR